MDREFWFERWRQNLIGFHQPEINAHLKSFWPRLGVTAGQPVFVPLCGKSLDMLWLRDQGHPVLGVELSPLAVEAFFAENGLEYDQHVKQGFTLYQSGHIQVLCGDFFDLRPEQVRGIGAVYDRASLIALPPEMRARYVEQLNRLLPGPLPMLLVTLEYDQAQMQGPPFSVSEPEVRELLATRGSLQRVFEEDILAGEPRFRERGLSDLREKIYLLNQSAPGDAGPRG